jgi:hypothetical protein
MMRGRRPFSCGTSSFSSGAFLNLGVIPKPSEAVLGGGLSFIAMSLAIVHNHASNRRRERM